MHSAINFRFFCVFLFFRWFVSSLYFNVHDFCRRGVHLWRKSSDPQDSVCTSEINNRHYTEVILITIDIIFTIHASSILANRNHFWLKNNENFTIIINTYLHFSNFVSLKELYMEAK